MPVNSIARLSPNYAHSRVIVASAIGLGFAAGLMKFCSIAVALLGGWDAGGLVMLVFAWSIIWTANARETEARAAAVDPGARLVYVLVLLTARAGPFRDFYRSGAGVLTLLVALALSALGVVVLGRLGREPVEQRVFWRGTRST